jgi:hypothetical protein
VDSGRAPLGAFSQSRVSFFTARRRLFVSVSQ